MKLDLALGLKKLMALNCLAASALNKIDSCSRIGDSLVFVGVGLLLTSFLLLVLYKYLCSSANNEFE